MSKVNFITTIRVKPAVLSSIRAASGHIDWHRVVPQYEGKSFGTLPPSASTVALVKAMINGEGHQVDLRALKEEDFRHVQMLMSNHYHTGYLHASHYRHLVIGSSAMSTVSASFETGVAVIKSVDTPIIPLIQALSKLFPQEPIQIEYNIEGANPNDTTYLLFTDGKAHKSHPQVSRFVTGIQNETPAPVRRARVSVRDIARFQ